MIAHRRARILIRTLAAGLVLAASFFWATLSMADEGDDSPNRDETRDAATEAQGASTTSKMESYLAMKTLGGRQFWGDLAYFHQWRIQRNVLTGHCRLLDGNDFRHASGTLEECREKLEEIKRVNDLPPMKGRAVILVHGIFRSSKSMSKFRDGLEGDGCEVFGFEYPSTRVQISDSAEYLNSVIESLDGVDDIQFIVHSMGGLVVRAYLDKHRDPRISRMVMIGVPNLGAELADLLKQNLLFKALYGPAGQQLVSGADGFIAHLPTPDFEFGILAGARGTLGGYNTLIDGDDDGTVSVACTRLPGASDYISVPCLHSFLVLNGEAVALTQRFLKDGHFRENGERHAIPVARPAARQDDGTRAAAVAN